VNIAKNCLLVGLACFLLCAGMLDAQSYDSRIGMQRGGKVSFEPRGPGVLFGALDPAVKKWYVPQELFLDYSWRQWEYSNYARDPYQRYVNTSLEGGYFYDFYGNFIGHGWLIYDWRQNQPQQLGSGIFQDTRFSRWFNSVTIGGDAKGQYFYSITVGNRIRTTLTPMTFSKPTFNGVQLDFASDKYHATILASRISDPISGATREPVVRTNQTTFFGGRATFQVGDFVELGATLVNAHNANTALDLFGGDLFAGNLTNGQSSTPLTAIAVVLSDDSPQDGEGGTALFNHDMRIVSRDFETDEESVFTLQEVTRPGAEWPIVFGGFVRPDFLAADGQERIVLNYDFNDPGYIGPDPTTIVKVEFDYLVGNDFKIEMWSDRQSGRHDTPIPPLSPETIDSARPALATVRRAPGNIKDTSNLQRVRFDYGLPTANLVGGFSIEGSDVWGFDFYGEWDRNKRYYQYPNAALFTAGKNHKISTEQSDAWFFNLSRQFYPWFFFGEVYAMDDAYSTTAFLVDANGDIQYDNSQRNFYEFVEDNDDQDQYPDWIRAGSANDRLIFPGWDENNDFISDFNQNDNGTVNNLIPDYEEPFLRYAVDRPEFLFGIDLNNNAWIDRFEDDDLPDYPYKTDRQGYNVFAGAELVPGMRLTLGQADEQMISADRSSRVQYALFTFDRDVPGVGRLRVFDALKKVADTIPDDRRAPTPYVDAPAIQPLVPDILPAQDTWVNSLWLGFDYAGIDRLNIINKFKYEFYRQNQDDPRDIDGRRLRTNTSFFGLINKFDYTYDLGRFSLQPKFKSEYLRRTPFLVQEDERKEWTGSFVLLAQLPVLQHTVLMGGVEQLLLRDLMRDEDAMVASGVTTETGDLSSVNVAVQLSNSSDYMGYRLTTQVGLRYGRTQTELVLENDSGFAKGSESSNSTTSFITVYAGIQ
jgi:hypothetical protein